jgi:MFS-type transporter involved in bile tolerance (Atg22 family)
MQTGAVVGTFVYPILQTYFGIADIMWMQVAVSLIGVLVSLVFLNPVYPPGLQTAARGSARAWRDWFCL